MGGRTSAKSITAGFLRAFGDSSDYLELIPVQVLVPEAVIS